MSLLNSLCLKRQKWLSINSRKTESSVVKAIDETLSFELETDASDAATAALLSQVGHSVAFFSRTLQGSEKHHSAVEKEANTITESVRRWSHYLIGKHFSIKTDQRCVTDTFDRQQKNIIKN